MNVPQVHWKAPFILKNHIIKYLASSKCTKQEIRSLTFTHRNPDVLKVITPPLPWPGWTPIISKEWQKQENNIKTGMSVILEKWDKTGWKIEKNKTLYSDKLNYIYVSYMN